MSATGIEPLPGPGPRVAVVGGSVGGLTAALVLRSIGCDLDVYERAAPPLEGRGAGIVLHRETLRWPTGPGGIPVEEISTPCRALRYLARDGSVAYERAADLRFTAWNTLYRSLLDDFGEERYHRGAAAEEAVEGGVRLASGAVAPADLVVAADGFDSTLRRRLMPGVRWRSAGYLGWRGVVEEERLSAGTRAALADAVTYHAAPGTHIVLYLIPDAAGAEPGRRRANYVWYRNPTEEEADSLLGDGAGGRRMSVPPGGVPPPAVEELRAAARAALPPQAAEVVVATEQPFVQAIGDLESPRLVVGRVAIIGDAAFVARPHAAAGTAKACADAWALGEALAEAGGDVDRALAAWEPGRLEAGRGLVGRAARNGDRSQFGGGWTPGDPSLAFGLYVPGDSEGGW